MQVRKVTIQKEEHAQGPRFSSFCGVLFLGVCSAVFLAACDLGTDESQTVSFVFQGEPVEVRFLGEVSDDVIFGKGISLLDTMMPADEHGRPVGHIIESRPGWLAFQYRIGNARKEVLVARQPLIKQVSWNQITNGYTSGNTSEAEGRDAVLKALNGDQYIVRFPDCGTKTLAHLSEWNLLIGGVHRGDMDFQGVQYGWIEKPYSDRALNVGFGGSLTWCKNQWKENRVVRGYFYVSRFHASDPDAVTDRLSWRPVLERVTADQELTKEETNDRSAMVAQNDEAQTSPDGRVTFHGVHRHEQLFDASLYLDNALGLDAGFRFHTGQTDWIEFSDLDKRLFVARWPVRSHLSWNDLARAGLVSGDGQIVWINGRPYRQSASIEDLNGRRFRVRLLSCGGRTLAHESEWNRLMGAIHMGDADFLDSAMLQYAWIDGAMGDIDLNIGTRHGGTTWCLDHFRIAGKRHAVNRGYHTISRFHATDSGYVGSGFGWRPVLELIP